MQTPNTEPIRFDDGAAYERYMGLWSRLAGEKFLEWLCPPPSLRWLDVGCGTGAFTEMIADRCAPSSLHGIDPSEAQLAYARARPALRAAEFRQGDAMVLPYSNAAFDAAVMPLVIFFVPEPAKGVREMARVVAPGGLVTAYAWDLVGVGFPYDALQSEMRAMGIAIANPPSPEASRIEVLQELWRSAGLVHVATHEIHVQRTFIDFEDYWSTVLGGPSVATKLAAMTPDSITTLRATMRARLPTDASGRITYGALAHAVSGRVPKSRSKPLDGGAAGLTSSLTEQQIAAD